jgi:hypothetical protein
MAGAALSSFYHPTQGSGSTIKFSGTVATITKWSAAAIAVTAPSGMWPESLVWQIPSFR